MFSRFVFLLCTCMVIACGGRQPSASAPEGPKAEEVERIYNLFLQGQYEAYVAEMASCDSMPDFYRRQMVDLCKQHAYQQKERNGGAVQATVVRIDLAGNGLQANVFLRVLYEDHSHEEILISMVKQNDRWRLQ